MIATQAMLICPASRQDLRRGNPAVMFQKYLPRKMLIIYNYISGTRRAA
jgi:hypothetical protein